MSIGTAVPATTLYTVCEQFQSSDIAVPCTTRLSGSLIGESYGTHRFLDSTTGPTFPHSRVCGKLVHDLSGTHINLLQYEDTSAEMWTGMLKSLSINLS